jgi:hypothetical protein
MDAQAVTQLITNLGFPIVCCLALGYFVWKFANKLNDDSISRENRLMDYNMNQRLTIVESKVEDKIQGK